MKISMDIIASDMADVISEKNLLPDTDLSIYSVRYLVANETEFLDVYEMCIRDRSGLQGLPQGRVLHGKIRYGQGVIMGIQ